MSDESLLQDDGPGRVRRCVAARQAKPADRMIRFVVGPDRALVPDLAADELIEMAGQTGQEAGLDEALAGDIIMDARRRLGWIEDEPTPPEPEAEADETA